MNLVNYYDRLIMFDMDSDFVKSHHAESRIFISMITRAVTDVILESSPRKTKLKAFYWLVLEDDEHQSIARSIGLRLLNMDHSYLVNKLKEKLGNKKYGEIAVAALKLPPHKREWL